MIEEAGIHEIHVMLKGDHIEGSPFHIQVDSIPRTKFIHKRNSKLRLSFGFSGSPVTASKKRVFFFKFFCF